MVNAMSDLSIPTVYESAVRPQEAVKKLEVGTASGGGVGSSIGSKSAPDVSDYVTSPKGVVDPQSGVYILQYRDGATGEVLNQYPSAKVVDAYKRGASSGGVATSPAVSAQGSFVDGFEKVAVPAPSQSASSSGGQGSSTPVLTPALTPALLLTSVDA